MVVGSTGYYEIVYNQASAAKLLGVSLGAPVELKELKGTDGTFSCRLENVPSVPLGV
jgi:hypothetical protein